MDSFEQLGLGPALVEALASEGIERPTSLQTEAGPVVRRGNNILIAAGPGSGVTVAWGAALLDRLEPSESPVGLVLTPTAERADQLAESLGRLAAAVGHSVGALGSHWVLPDRQSFLFATPADVLQAVQAGGLKLDGIDALVVDQAGRLETLGGLDEVEGLLEYLPKESQRIVTALPVSDGVRSFVERHARRAMTVPGGDPTAEGGPKRGTVRFRVTPEPREAAALDIVSGLLADDARHVLVFCRNEDRAADVGDYLTLHGFVAGAPGDTSLPIWLGIDALEAREAIGDATGFAVVSCDAPTDADELDRRHALAEEGVVVLLTREVPHLRATARAAGYTVVPFPPAERRSASVVEQLHAQLRAALEREDVAPYLLALEPLFDEHDPAEVAAAAVALLRRREETPKPEAPQARTVGAPSWSKLFLGVGARDGLTTGDLLGAITGEAGVAGEAVGRIDIKESHSLVEVHDTEARKVIKALNGTTIRGRAVRADFDRPKRGGAAGRGGPPKR